MNAAAAAVKAFSEGHPRRMELTRAAFLLLVDQVLAGEEIEKFAAGQARLANGSRLIDKREKPA